MPEPLNDDAGPLRIDRRARRVWLHGDEVELTPKEFDLLALLTEEPGVARTAKRSSLTFRDENWWGPTKTLDVHIASLRRKLRAPMDRHPPGSRVPVRSDWLKP